MMSENFGDDSGVESDYDFDDFNDSEEKSGKSLLARIRSKHRKPPTIIHTQIRNSNDPTKPPLVLGRQGTVENSIDADNIIQSSNITLVNRTNTL